MKKGRVSGVLATVLAVAYAIYIVSYFSGIAMDSAGAAIATALVTPHMVCVAVGALMAVLGTFTFKRGFMLAAGILLVVAAAIFPTYAMFTVVQSILAFIAYVRMGKEN